MDQAVNRRPLTAEAPGNLWPIPMEFPVGKEEVEQVWLRVLRYHSTKDNALYFVCHRGNTISVTDSL